MFGSRDMFPRLLPAVRPAWSGQPSQFPVLLWVRDCRVSCWLAVVFSPWRDAGVRKSADLRLEMLYAGVPALRPARLVFHPALNRVVRDRECWRTDRAKSPTDRSAPEFYHARRVLCRSLHSRLRQWTLGANYSVRQL